MGLRAGKVSYSGSCGENSLNRSSLPIPLPSLGHKAMSKATHRGNIAEPIANNGNNVHQAIFGGERTDVTREVHVGAGVRHVKTREVWAVGIHMFSFKDKALVTSGSKWFLSKAHGPKHQVLS